MGEVTVRYNPTSGIWIEVKAENPKDAVKAMSAFQEVFGETTCGLCHSKAISWEHRVVQDNDFYSVRCRSCGGELNFGQTKVGNRLFAKRKEHPETNGWHKWEGRQDTL